jgi:carbamoyl-phosphate synthase small subunit
MGSAYLILETGEVFVGEGFGAAGECVGELVFNTGVVGYIESLTDPSYRGQILLFTFPLVGNYGMIPEDFESGSCHVQGVVLREYCETPSNFRCQGTLDAFLKAQGVPGIAGVDTRRITQLVREHGVMNARICTSLPDGVPQEVRGYRVTGSVAATSAKAVHTYMPEGTPVCDVALLDYGAKQNILRELLARDCRVTVFPQDTPAETVLAADPDGIMLSNGPGDPADNTACIAELQKLLGKKPIFGICLGHQLLALAAGGQTVKLKYGHRGSNQPVRDLSTGRVYITSQNHGYAVLPEQLDRMGAVLSHVNANDGTCEGLDYPALGAFSLQFHPEAHAGPRDMEFAFEKFIRMMGGAR